MAAVERVDIEPIRTLLRMAAPAKAMQLDELFQRLSPVCEIDREQERVLFQADAGQNLIRIGTKCTIRLQAHAFAAGVIIAGFGGPDFAKMAPEERRKLFAPADVLFTWAVGRDLQQWLERIEGCQRELSNILRGAENELPEDLLASLSKEQRGLGEGFFRLASSYILLHELGHLHYGHRPCRGYWSIQQEKDADYFAADWLLEAASQKEGDNQARRLNVLFGISVALLWLTVFNVYLGRSESNTHPEGYDRLFQVLDREIDTDNDTEWLRVWFFVSTMFFTHMWSAGFDFKPEQFQGDDPRDEANRLIDMISRRNPA